MCWEAVRAENDVAAEHDLRVDFPDVGACGQNEPETVDSGAGE